MNATATFSIIVPVWHPDPAQLQESIDSVLAQTDPSWQLILVADGPQLAAVQAILGAAATPGHNGKGDVQVHYRATQGGIVAASNDAIAAATGEFVAFLDNDDVLASHALEAFSTVLEDHDDVDVMYSDEDKYDLGGRRVDPFHKPAWSPERLRSQMYLGHLCAYRRSLVNEVGCLRPEYDGAQDHDLALRVTELARRIVHVPQVLYHWRMGETSTALDPANKDWAFEAGVRAVQSHLDRCAIPARARRDRSLVGVVAVEPQLRQFPKVSIIMLTGGTSRVVRGEDLVMATNAIASVVAHSTYPNYEILVVIDHKSTDELAAELVDVGRGRVRVVQDTRPFSFSDSNNLGVSHADGDYLVFLNDDTEVITANWIERLVLSCSLSGVGAVGCCLEYPDGRVQHAGVVGRFGGPSHRHAGLDAASAGPFGVLGQTVNALAVTAACIGMRREVFDQVGGFCSGLPLNFNDVDLCLKLINAGYRNVLDNRTRLVHLETSTRPVGSDTWESDFLRRRWETLLWADPWDNPNLEGAGVEDLAPPTALTAYRELVGAAHFAPRVWPDLSQR